MLAILLVVEDPAKGGRVVHRHPASQCTSSSCMHFIHTGAMRTLDSLCAQSNPDTLAGLLRPKVGLMCNRPFRLTVNNILFVGYPMNIHKNDRQKDSITYFNIVFAIEWIQRPNTTFIGESEDSIFEDTYSEEIGLQCSIKSGCWGRRANELFECASDAFSICKVLSCLARAVKYEEERCAFMTRAIIFNDSARKRLPKAKRPFNSVQHQDIDDSIAMDMKYNSDKEEGRKCDNTLLSNKGVEQYGNMGAQIRNRMDSFTKGSDNYATTSSVVTYQHKPGCNSGNRLGDFEIEFCETNSDLHSSHRNIKNGENKSDEFYHLLRHVFESVQSECSCYVTVNNWLSFSVRLHERHLIESNLTSSGTERNLKHFQTYASQDKFSSMPLVPETGFTCLASFFNGTFSSSLDGSKNDSKRRNITFATDILLQTSLQAFRNFSKSQYQSHVIQLGEREEPLNIQSHNLAASFRPYQTLLLVREETEILSALPPDASIQLLTLVKHANPLHSFQELSVTTGIPLQQVHRLAAHLTYWGQARVIDTILGNNKYRVNSLAILSTSAAAKGFTDKFQNNRYSLNRVLSLFQPPDISIYDVMKKRVPQQDHELFLHMLVWLLQQNLLHQIHPNIYLVKPTRFPADRSSEGLKESWNTEVGKGYFLL